MSKFLKIILFIGIVICGYIVYDNMIANRIPPIETNKTKVDLSSYYIYGRSLNMKGTFSIEDATYENICLTLYNGKETDIKINYKADVNKIIFNISDEVNDGLFLDNIKKGKYYLFIKATYQDPDDSNKKKYEYYSIKNNTDYETTDYYTMSYENKKINISSDNDYNTLMLNVTKNEDKNIYDIVLDPGHGGMDGGAESIDKKNKETDFTLDIAASIKKKLEKFGLKVKLTWNNDNLSSDEVLEEYNAHGRAVISSEVKAKYVFSIHVNSNQSTSVHGLEVYTPVNINYNLAESFVKNITTDTGLEVSNGKTYKIYPGIYSHNFTEAEIKANVASQKAKGYKPYDITTDSNYFYMIRETGGIITGAYVDGRNKKVGTNKYYDSNIGAEAYILELGYITNKKNLTNLKNKQDKYINAIVKSIKEELKIS